MLLSSEVIKNSGVKFGTSGARGLVKQFTSDVCVAFTYAFINCMEKQFTFSQVAIAIDNRPSSVNMARSCANALQLLGYEVVYYGVVPTPALAYVSMQDNIPAIMVTGSHIPFDRNGLKFYRPDGEINKSDEEAILDASVEFDEIFELPNLNTDNKAAKSYIDRYTSLFDSSLLDGMRIGIYEHSSSGRDLYSVLFSELGAEVISLERTDEFVPIDTEAVSELDKEKSIKWSDKFELDFIFSTDGDGDRPLVSDQNGEWLRGDILGLLCANVMNITSLVVPVSCNTAIEKSGLFESVTRTKIGSPYVIAEFEKLTKRYGAVAGFEANGGFILGSDVEINGRVLKALPTRDAVLPAIMLLAASKEKCISDLVNSLPKRMTHSDRIQNFQTEKSLEILAKAIEQPEDFLNKLSFTECTVSSIDTTDGLRISLSNNDVIHFRPSGNAPELRCYAESSTFKQAKLLVNQSLNKIQLI